jgi:single-stranded-DNA-specific exonuclease
VDVVVTDHHDLSPTLPDACAVVNPKMLPKSHPLRELPGVGAAYKLAELLYERAGQLEGAAQHLDLVALGIVADVATQTGDTRYLLQRGLEALRHTKRLGLQVMMETAELNPDLLTEEHIGFVLAPRLNALGRLSDATVAVEFLTTTDLARARILATEMEGLNARRKLLCDQIIQAAEAQIERDSSLLKYGALVLSHPSWPPGVVGIVAGRLAERYYKPALLIATPPGEMGRGSARSVEGCDIHAAIAAHGEMLGRFGGHPMAAGLSIDPERIPEFRRALSRTVLEMRGEVEERVTLQIDGYLDLADLSLGLVKELERLAPFGSGNPPLALASRGLTLKSHSTIGRSGEHLRLVVEDEAGAAQKVLWWRGAGHPLPQGRFDLAYVVRASDYRGQRDVQVEWVDAREKAPIPRPKAQISKPKVRVVDYREEANPRGLLEQLRAQEDVQVWSEAGARAGIAGQDRYELGPSKGLVVWTTPPGPGELQAVLERVSPEMVYLFGINPGLDHPEEFLKRLAGLTKHALNSHQGRAKVSTLAAATAQREVTARLKALLEETAAYRAHFARADKEALSSSLGGRGVPVG